MIELVRGCLWLAWGPPNSVSRSHPCRCWNDRWKLCCDYLWWFNEYLMSLQIAHLVWYRFKEYLLVCLEVLCITFCHMSKKVGPCDAFIWLNGQGSRQGNCNNRTDIAPIHFLMFLSQVPSSHPSWPFRAAVAGSCHSRARGHRRYWLWGCWDEDVWGMRSQAETHPQNYTGHGVVSGIDHYHRTS